MTRKHFEAIAKVFKDRKYTIGGPSAEHLRRCLVGDMADYLATTNDQFNRQRFLTACDVNAEDE